jgi:hypothetical protein
LRVIGKAAATGVGIFFMGIQLLSLGGFVDVKWNKVEDAATKALDQNGG